MKIVAENHADSRARRAFAMPAPYAAAVIGHELEALYRDLRTEVPPSLVDLAARIDRQAALHRAT